METDIDIVLLLLYLWAMDIKITLDLREFNEEASKVLGVSRSKMLDSFSDAMGSSYQLSAESDRRSGYLVATIVGCSKRDMVIKYNSFAGLARNLNIKLFEEDNLKTGRFKTIQGFPGLGEGHYAVGINYAKR